MDWKTYSLIIFGGLAFIAVFYGIGRTGESVRENEHELKLACLRSGKSLIGDSCVRVAP